MAKSSIFTKIKNKFKSIRLWFVFKYHRWIKKEVPYMKTVYGDKYKYMPIAPEDEHGVLETWAYPKDPGESTEYARMQAAKALTRGRPEPGYEMPRLIRERNV